MSTTTDLSTSELSATSPDPGSATPGSPAAADATTEAEFMASVLSFVEKVGSDQAIALNAVLVYLGDRLGIWKALASVPAATSRELADRTGLDERYLREWLSAQAAAGYVSYDPADQRFQLPPAHAMVLADDESPAAMAGPFEFMAAIWGSTDRLAHAFATGEGVGWHEHDARLPVAVERFFRPLYLNSLLAEWLPAVDGLQERLAAGARVLDVGCGLGAPTIMLAEAFPRSTFVGIDYHDDSIRRAREAARRAGVEDRVTFEQLDHDDYAGGPYDVIFLFDALHDMGDPVGALRHARSQLAEDGVVFAVEPAAGDALEDNLHVTGLSWYASSTLVCLPGSLSQEGHAGLGAQAGPTRTLAAFEAAGLSDARLAATTMVNMVYTATR